MSKEKKTEPQQPGDLDLSKYREKASEHSPLDDLSRWGRDAYLNTVANIVPGMRGCDVFKLAEKEIYRQDWNQLIPIDFVGHSIGSLTHEPPFLAEREPVERERLRKA